MNNAQWWQKLPSDVLWYLVGLIATDGCLSTDGRHVDVTAKEYSFLEQIKLCCKMPNSICRKANGCGQISYHFQLSSRLFYDFLLGVGMMPNKSKKLGELGVPKCWFCDFMRGVIDGDGGIRKWLHPTNGVEQWSVRIVGASASFIEWIERRNKENFGVSGRIYCEKNGKSLRWVLKYGKLAAQKLLAICYYEGMSIALDRKKVMARKCCLTKRGWKNRAVVSKWQKGFDRKPGWRNWQTQGTQ